MVEATGALIRLPEENSGLQKRIRGGEGGPEPNICAEARTRPGKAGSKRGRGNRTSEGMDIGKEKKEIVKK